MHVNRDRNPSRLGPSDWFTGLVYLDAVSLPTDGSRLNINSVHFSPGARTAWHTHPNGQTLYVTEGQGRAQQRGGPVEAIRSGDSVVIGPGEVHWHGADSEHFMTHLSIVEADENGNTATWGVHVSDAEYGA